MKKCILSQHLKAADRNYIKVVVGTLFIDRKKPEDQKKYID